MLSVLLGPPIEGAILDALLLLFVHFSLAWHCLRPTGHKLLYKKQSPLLCSQSLCGLHARLQGCLSLLV